MNADFCTHDGQNPVISSAWLTAALAPLARELYQDSCECGEACLDEGEWVDLLKNDLMKLLNAQGDCLTKRLAALGIHTEAATSGTAQ